jgi:hypothetical protein
LSLGEITGIEKNATENAIDIDTKEKKHSFKSFVQRDKTYEELKESWAASKNKGRPRSSTKEVFIFFDNLYNYFRTL